MKTVAMAAALGLFLVSCGALAGGIDKGKLEAEIRYQVGRNAACFEKSGKVVCPTVTEVSCVRDTDDFHFTCLVVQNEVGRTVLKATCDKSGSCLWRPE